MSSEVSKKALANLIRSRETIRQAIELLDKAIGNVMDSEMDESQLPYPKVWNRVGVDEELRAEGRIFMDALRIAMDELETLFRSIVQDEAYWKRINEEDAAILANWATGVQEVIDKLEVDDESRPTPKIQAT